MCICIISSTIHILFCSKNKTGTTIENIVIERVNKALNVNPAKHLSRLKLNIMKTNISNLLLAGIFISGVALTSCSKSDTMNDLNNNPQQLAVKSASFDAPADKGMLNQNLRITYASDNGTDITQQFQLYTFRFVGTYPGGEAQVWNDLFARLGSWGAEEPGTISIAYPTDPFWELAFLNRVWTVIEKTSGSFTLIANDGDEVHFTVKKE